MHDELKYLAESVEGTDWLLLVAFSKIREVRNKFREELFKKKKGGGEPGLDDLKSSLSIHMQKV